MKYPENNWLIYTVLLIVLLAACVISLFVGAVRVPLGEMLDSGIIQMRAARILLAVIAGAGLSVAGVILQGLLRNPLAEPYVLGVSSGAGLAAAAAIILKISLIGIFSIPAAAFVGAFATVFLVYALAREASGAVPVHTLLLSGVIVSAVFGSILMFIVSVCPAENLHNVMWWLLGSLQIFDFSLLRIVFLVVVVGILVTLFFSRDLNLIALGEEPAAHLGLNVEQAKKMFFLLASAITAAVVSACGLIGFAGLIVPHTVRLAIGPDNRRLVPACALAGATFLVLADAFARVVIAPKEIPIGVVTAFLGGPFFLFLLKRKKRSYWS